MIIGHYAVAFGVKKAVPKVSLGTLFLAAQFLDLLCYLLILFGIERVELDETIAMVFPFKFVHYGVSHSLVAAFVWAFLLALLYKVLKRNLRSAIWVGVAVLSHWPLDAVVHGPDMPLLPKGQMLMGLGLWRSLAGTIAVEMLLFVLGIFIYFKSTRPKKSIGTKAFWGLVFFLVVAYLGTVLLPLAPTTATVLLALFLQILIIVSAFWVDRNRKAIA